MQADCTTSQPIDSATRTGSPAQSAISRLRDWKLEPRIQSTTLMPSATACAVSSRSRTSGGTSSARRSRNFSPRSRRISRVTIISRRSWRGVAAMPDAQVGQQLAIDGHPLVDPAAHQELEGQGAAQLLDLARAGGLAGAARTRGPPRAIGRRRPAHRASSRRRACSASVAAAQFQRPAEEPGRVVEGQGLRRLPRGLDVVFAGLLRPVGGVEVDRQRLGVAAPGGLQRRRPAARARPSAGPAPGG